jgi:hypothetical protein
VSLCYRVLRVACQEFCLGENVVVATLVPRSTAPATVTDAIVRFRRGGRALAPYVVTCYRCRLLASWGRSVSSATPCTSGEGRQVLYFRLRRDAVAKKCQPRYGVLPGSRGNWWLWRRRPCSEATLSLTFLAFPTWSIGSCVTGASKIRDRIQGQHVWYGQRALQLPMCAAPLLH